MIVYFTQSIRKSL